MENKKKDKNISRRRFMPLVGAALLIPLAGKSNPTHPAEVDDTDELETLLTPNGEIVKVKRSALKKGKVLKKKMSNKSLLGWLKSNKKNKR